MKTQNLANRIFKIFAWVIGALVVLALLFFTRVDRKDYRLEEYYLNTMGHLDTLSLHPSAGDFWMAGWSKVNAVPERPGKLLGYRPRGRYEFVQDSSVVRALVVGNGQQKVAFLNFDLMIVHPYLKQRVVEKIRKHGLPLDLVYFTATHTHSGLGGFIPGVLGKIALGSFDESIVELLENGAVNSLRQAISTMDTVEIRYRKLETDSLIANRLIEGNPVDPFIRQIIFEKQAGEMGSFVTFSAHPTILASKFMGLSGDYPHYLNELMEIGGYDFSMFAAGTVGSMRPMSNGYEPSDVHDFADRTYRQLSDKPGSVFSEQSHLLKWATLPVEMRKAHFRLTKNIRIRPWIFNSLLGDPNPHFDLVRLGNVLLLSSSGEISGEMMEAWEFFALENGLHLIVTCFNGGYIGYITPDDYYDLELYETRDMNWYGPYNGAYFDEIIRKSIVRSAEK